MSIVDPSFNDTNKKLSFMYDDSGIADESEAFVEQEGRTNLHASMVKLVN